MERYIPPQELIKGGIRLDTNEVPYEIPVEIPSTSQINRYRDSSYDDLVQALAAKHHVHETEIVLGAGSSQLLDASIAAFGQKGVRAPHPTYRQYRHLAKKHHLTYEDVPTNSELQIDTAAFSKNNRSLSIISNPNNPTGNYIDIQTVRKIAQKSATTIVDEAYIEFAEPEASSTLELTDDKEILIVIRTFSKAYAAAGLRMSYAVSSADKVKSISSQQPLYPTGALQHQVALQLLAQEATMREKVAALNTEKERLSGTLCQLGCTVLPSVTNFFLFKLPTRYCPQEVHSKLIKKGIVVRSMADQTPVKDYLRVSVSSQEENNAFIEALTNILLDTNS